METLKNLVPQNLKNLYHLFQAFTANVAFGFPGRKLKVIGVTGTDGKTTTTHLIYHILKEADIRVSMVSSVAAFVGHNQIDTGFHVTTPDPFPLQKLLRRAVDEGSEYAVVESTSHGLDQNRLWGIPFYIGVFTNLSHEHRDYHKTKQDYLKAKLKLFKETSFAILNQDDPNFHNIERHAKGRIITYGIDHSAEIRAKNIHLGADNFAFEAEEMHLKVPLFGQYNIYNTLAAIGVAEAIGIDNKAIKAALETFPGVVGRMEKVSNNRGISVFVDFAHTPNAIENLLKNLKKTRGGKLIAVFGSAGKRDKTKRPLMGLAAKKYADITVLTAEDPRGEDVVRIAQDIIKDASFTLDKDLFIIPEREQAIYTAINKLAKRGDTVVTLGKAHEKSLNLDGLREQPWDEFKAVKKALGEKL